MRRANRQQKPKGSFGKFILLFFGGLLIFSAFPGLKAHHFSTENLTVVFLGLLLLYFGLKR